MWLPCILISGSLIYSEHAHTSAGCIQPEIRVVHHELGLIDVRNSDQGLVVERSTGRGEIALTALGDQHRLRLSENEEIRFRSLTGQTTDWIDPFTIAEPSVEAEQTPAWAIGTVWYNIFPERFDNAVPENDQGWPHGTSVSWHADWFDVTPDEFEASANRAIADPRRYGDDHDRKRPPLRDVVFERRFGGDLQGVLRRLDHVQQLGAESIWFCPVFDAVSLHKYDATDHRHIDPHLASPGNVGRDRPLFVVAPDRWTWTEADRFFVNELLTEIHSRKMRVILDGVWNHVGFQHPAFQDAINRGRASPYFEWFVLALDESAKVVGWQAWNRRNGNLPEFSQINGDLVPGPKQHVFDVTDRWMDPNGDGDPSDGIDGWRLDVANEIGLRFWEDWRQHVRELNPDALLIGELWFDGGDYFGGKAFDAQMNYPVAFVLVPWLSGIPNPDIATQLADAMEQHPATQLAQMNLLASHDTARLVSVLANPGLGYDRGAGMGNADFDRSIPDEADFDRLELAYAVLTALPGSPMVFAGDELGVWGGDDPENRKPLPWPDITHDEQLGNLARKTTNRVGHWLRLRSDPAIGSVLRYGGVSLHLEQQLLVIERTLNNSTIRLYANPTNSVLESSVGTLKPRSAALCIMREADRWVRIHEASEKSE
ncbi:MAG: hypothetical protein ED559_06395 [Phycisphaera sp.]|nr:MAG: hypothetical protein ED559_06395 [Phycisphaera sp.]